MAWKVAEHLERVHVPTTKKCLCSVLPRRHSPIWEKRCPLCLHTFIGGSMKIRTSWSQRLVWRSFPARRSARIPARPVPMRREPPGSHVLHGRHSGWTIRHLDSGGQRCHLISTSRWPAPAWGPNYDLFLDTDNNTTTGYSDGVFNGANKLIENGGLSTTSVNGSDWANWTYVGTTGITSTATATLVTVQIQKSILGTLASTIRVAVEVIARWCPRRSSSPSRNHLTEVVDQSHRFRSNLLRPLKTPSEYPVVVCYRNRKSS